MLMKINREGVIFDKRANIFLEILKFVSSLSVEDFMSNFTFQRVALFSDIIFLSFIPNENIDARFYLSEVIVLNKQRK